MPRSCSRPSTRALLIAKFEALLDECDLVALSDDEKGQTLDLLEDFFLDKGRKFLRETFQEKLQERIEHTESATEAKQCSHCKKKHVTKTTSRKT